MTGHRRRHYLHPAAYRGRGNTENPLHESLTAIGAIIDRAQEMVLGKGEALLHAAADAPLLSPARQMLSLLFKPMPIQGRYQIIKLCNLNFGQTKK